MQRVLPIFQKLIFFYMCVLTFFYSSLNAAPLCSAVFSNAAGTTSGNLSANSGAKLYNTETNGNILAVGSLTGVTNICQGGTTTCTTTSRASTMTLPISPSAGSNSALTINSGKSSDISADRTRQSASVNGTLNLNGDIYLNLKDKNGYAGDFTLNSGGVLNINGNVTIYANNFNFNGTIKINSGSLTLVGTGNVTFNSGSATNTGGANDKIVILNAGTTTINSTVNAIIYSSGSATINSGGVVNGSITASSIMLNGTIYFDQSAINTATIPGCDKIAVNIGERDFAIRNPASTRNIKGGLKVIGNTVLCVKDNAGNCYDYTGGSSNSELNLQYIDVNTTDNRTYNNSSSAQLSIPSTATIKWAALYTQGYLNGTDSNTIISSIKEAVSLTIPSIGTINSVPEVIDIFERDKTVYVWGWPSVVTDGYTYDTYAAIPSLIGKSGASVNGWITGANIKANTGTEDSGLGNFGAWTLVVVYEDLNTTLKNISVFDGYKSVDASAPTVNIPISGFLTPTHGVVNSTLSLFVGEGDKNIVGDKLYASNLSNAFVAINDTNAFYSGMSGFTAYPSYSNNQGIDIQNHQIGIDGNTSHPQIIGNGQKNTTIQLTSDQDAYFPSMVAFSTELYVPDVCYEETITKNGTVPTQIYAGDILDFEVLISNKSAEPAQKISIKRIFGDNMEYQTNSTSVKSGGTFQPKTDAANDDVVTYTDSTNSLVVNLGTGATATSGGTIIKDQNETFRFKFQPQDDGNLTSAYLVTYRDDSNVYGTGSVIYNDVPIGKCSDRKITSTVIPILPSGKVRIVESGKNWNDNGGRLFTKIVNKSTNYDILYATDNTGATPATGDIQKVEILNIENLASPIIVATPITTTTTIPQRKLITITHGAAYKRLQFKITLKDGSIATSNDFSVRPADFSGTLSDFWAGEPLTLNTLGMISARDNNGVASTLYNQTLDTLNIDSITIDPSKTCSANTIATLIGTFSTAFTNGKSTAVNATFKDIADNLTIRLKDSSWVSNSDDVMNSDCVAGSGSNTANAAGQFGCNVEGNVLVSIKPYELNVTNATFTASTGQNWLYDANVTDMSVRATATVQANTMQHAALQNFTANCYAQPVNLTFSYATNNTNGNINLSYATTTGALSSNLKSINDSNKTIVLNSSLFTTSSVTADYSFNIDRNISSPLNPVDMNLTAVQITTPNVAKNENNATRLENNAPTSVPITFYYGRVYSTDYRGTNTTPIPTTIRYEVYCKDCNTTRLNALGTQSPTTLNWYQNPLHTNTTFGTVFQFGKIGTTTILNPTLSTIDANGFDTSHALTNATAPYVDRILMTPSAWLIFNAFNANATTNDFNVEFIRSGNWSGAGNVDRNDTSHTTGAFTNDTNITRSNRKMNW